jgi:hypothetical protein
LAKSPLRTFRVLALMMVSVHSSTLPPDQTCHWGSSQQ